VKILKPAWFPGSPIQGSSGASKYLIEGRVTIIHHYLSIACLRGWRLHCHCVLNPSVDTRQSRITFNPYLFSRPKTGCRSQRCGIAPPFFLENTYNYLIVLHFLYLNETVFAGQFPFWRKRLSAFLDRTPNDFGSKVTDDQGFHRKGTGAGSFFCTQW
jgi:hypothetical protein